jgi:hypothetical protein
VSENDFSKAGRAGLKFPWLDPLEYKCEDRIMKNGDSLTLKPWDK